jgi:glycosyltransferase involved in cell wall biosynthesis
MSAVSIVLPTHNREAYLRESIGSVLAQTWPDWRLIVVDDGSTDGTAAYLAGLADPRISVIRHDRCANPARLRNAGLARVTSRLVAFLDSDDRWAPDKLAVQLPALAAASPECRWSFTGYGRIDAAGRPFTLAGGRPLSWRSGWILSAMLRDEVSVALSSVVVERALMAEAGGFDETLQLCSDYDMWVRLANRARAAAVERPLVEIRAHTGNWTRGRGIEAHELLERVFQKLLAEVRDEGQRVLTRRRHGRALLALATHHRLAGDYRGALRALRRAAAYRPGAAAWGLGLVKALIRPAMPDAWMTRYYSWREKRALRPG